MAIEERDPMINIYVQETESLIEQLESILIESEKSENMETAINDIFRIMHTIKGNSMMMKYESIANLAHATEDLFDYLRTKHPENVNYNELTSVVLDSIDFMKEEVEKIQKDDDEFGDNSAIKEAVLNFLNSLKFMEGGEAPAVVVDITSQIAVEPVSYNNVMENCFFVDVNFEDDYQMENVRAFSIVHQLDEFGCHIYHYPADLENMDEAIPEIKLNGFRLGLNCKQNEAELSYLFDRISCLRSIEIRQVGKEEFEECLEGYIEYSEAVSTEVDQAPVVAKAAEETPLVETKEVTASEDKTEENSVATPKAPEKKEPKVAKEGMTNKQQKFINVSVDKLDALMNLVGELVVSESMLTQNPELKALKIASVEKSGGQMRSIINDVQDVVMEIRMLPLSTTFQKMNRIVRDMCIKTNKEVDLVLIGQETEVDKNIIEHISDPLMHLIRNAIDHGIEEPEVRIAKGKEAKGTVTLEAKNSGGDVWIIVRDDGKGLDRDKILTKAAERGSLKKPMEEYTDKEAYAFIFEAGLSTKEAVSNFSGRGVGMDAVISDLDKIGGTVLVESEKDNGSSLNLKIPLTLAIINGMVMAVGDSMFTLPITSIKESFKARVEDLVTDPDGNEMIMVRGECFSITRLHELFKIKTDVTAFEDGIFVMLKDEDVKLCLFVDCLIGEHQVVVKSFSKFINKIKGISGCSQLGSGDICLILDVAGIST